MKEYKLAAWPDLSSPYNRIGHHRMLSDMSHRYVTVSQLMASSGASRLEVRHFLQMLGEHGLLLERDAEAASTGSSFGNWLRRTLHRDTADAADAS